MYKPAFSLVRGAARVQARSTMRSSARNARGVTASATPYRRWHENGFHTSQQPKRSSGQNSRYKSRFPFKSTAVAGLSLAALANPDDRSPPPEPDCAFRDPSGWHLIDLNPQVMLDFGMTYLRAAKSNSVEEARNAQFEHTRNFLEVCLLGEIIEKGSVPGDIIFRVGQYVIEEDTKIFYVPSPVQGKSSTLCVSVHHDLSDNDKAGAFANHDRIVYGVLARYLEDFKEENAPHVFLFLHYPAGIVTLAYSRDDLLGCIERKNYSALSEQ
ncbi:hypothetical protein Daus18300_007655 [Diaporthe australafricana]|uniref:Uncharacterized protein n=1 Tax=Diaporthe australafricana TaxID=127596 RepID=A0ABR3WLB3_9PEZI